LIADTVHISLSHTYTKLHYIYSTANLFHAVNSFTNNVTQCLCIILVLRRQAEQQPAESCLLVTQCATCFSWASQLSLVSDGTPGESTPVDSYRLVSTWRLIGGGSGDYQAVTGFCHTLMIWSTVTN